MTGQHVGGGVGHVDADDIARPQAAPGEASRGPLDRGGEVGKGVRLLVRPPTSAGLQPKAAAASTSRCVTVMSPFRLELAT